jgi:hypothetical protein
MGLFKALTIMLIGFFTLSMVNSNIDTVEKIPIIGPFIKKHIGLYKTEIIISIIALVFLFL